MQQSEYSSHATYLSVIAYATAVVFAGGFVWVVGHRGLFLLDQSMMFDGGWRILQGQVPYRDFFSAFPLIPLYIQSLFFAIAGVDFSAMVLAGAVLNAAATACVIWIIRRLLPNQRTIAFVAGLVTAVWFEAPFGTLWFEQTAFFFNLVALVLLVGALGTDSYRGGALRVSAGVLSVAAMLSKQNAGVEFIPVAVGVAAVPFLWERQVRNALGATLQLFAGFFIAAVAFAAWLSVYSSPADFWHCYFVLASQIASDRIDTLRTIRGIITLRATFYYSAPAVVVLAVGLWKSWRSGYLARHAAVIAWIVLSAVFYQNLFKLHTDNEVENALPYLGLIYGLAVGFTCDIFWATGRVPVDLATKRARELLYAYAAVAMLAVPLYAGAIPSWLRIVQQFRPSTTFDDRLATAGLARVKWGEPTIISRRTGATLSRTDFERLNSWLSAANSNFFIFPDATMLYGLHHRISPQPWLYFSPGHSFLREDFPDVDATVVQSLRRNKVEVVVLETDCYLGNQDLLLNQMPRLRDWMQQEFVKETQFGIYEVWTSRTFHDRAGSSNARSSIN